MEVLVISGAILHFHVHLTICNKRLHVIQEAHGVD